MFIIKKQSYFEYRFDRGGCGSMPYKDEEDFEEKVNYMKNLFKIKRVETRVDK